MDVKTPQRRAGKACCLPQRSASPSGAVNGHLCLTPLQDGFAVGSKLSIADTFLFNLVGWEGGGVSRAADALKT